MQLRVGDLYREPRNGHLWGVGMMHDGELVFVRLCPIVHTGGTAVRPEWWFHHGGLELVPAPVQPAPDATVVLSPVREVHRRG